MGMPGRVKGVLRTLNEWICWSFRDTTMLPWAGSTSVGLAQAEAQLLRTLVMGFPMGAAA